MRVNNNQTINPSEIDSSPIQKIFLARSERVKSVNLIDSKRGGASDASGNVFIPATENAYDRTVRLHEALHVDFTAKKFKPKDGLDQGLEDARLHAYCARTKSVDSARRDEVTTAIKDLRQAIQKTKYQPATALTSLVILRAVAILNGEKRYSKLVKDASSLISEDYLSKCLEAIKLIKSGTQSKDFQKALKILKEYFKEDFQPEQKQPSSESESGNESSERSTGKSDTDTDKENGDTKNESKESSESESDSDSKDSRKDSDKSDKSDKEKSSKQDSDSDSSNGSESDESNEDGESEDASDSDSQSDSNSVSDSDSSKTGPTGEDTSEIIAIENVKKPKLVRVKVHPDAYRGPSISKYDAKPEEAKRLDSRYHKTLIVHRLDNNSSSSVPTIDGNRGRKSSLSGCRITASKLALTSKNNVRVFNRKRGEGGGAILIDNSGSMHIPQDVLVRFASSLPLATIAFYSAKDDQNRTKEGHLSIFAANGRRATTLAGIEVYSGYGNLVDYQAITWLMEQPGPRWYVGDGLFTGSWEYHCRTFFADLVQRKLVTHVRSLSAMTLLLSGKK